MISKLRVRKKELLEKNLDLNLPVEKFFDNEVTIKWLEEKIQLLQENKITPEEVLLERLAADV